MAEAGKNNDSESRLTPIPKFEIFSTSPDERVTRQLHHRDNASDKNETLCDKELNRPGLSCHEQSDPWTDDELENREERELREREERKRKAILTQYSHITPEVIVRTNDRTNSRELQEDPCIPDSNFHSINGDEFTTPRPREQQYSDSEYSTVAYQKNHHASGTMHKKDSLTRQIHSPEPPRVTPVRGGRLSLVATIFSGFQSPPSTQQPLGLVAPLSPPHLRRCQSDFSSHLSHRKRSSPRQNESGSNESSSGHSQNDSQVTGRYSSCGSSSKTNSPPDAIPEEQSYASSSSIEGDKSRSGEADSHCHTNKIRQQLDKKARFRLVLASLLCLAFMIGEMVGGLLAGSLAIISDAAHLLTDFASFMIALMALYLANKPATKKLSFGWYRAEILGAFTSILMLWVLTGILVYSAAMRIKEDDYEINASVMLITAATGVAFNIVLGVTLHQHTHSHGGISHGHSHGPSKPPQHQSKNDPAKQPLVSGSGATAHSHHSHTYGSMHDVEQGDRTPLLTDHSHSHSHSSLDGGGGDHKHGHGSNINVKAAFIHVLGDLFQSVGVLVAAYIIYFKPEWKIADPICTFMFSLFVLITTITIMRDIVVVLMEGAPRGISFADVQAAFLEVEGVLDIHNLRVWSLTMDKVALSVHLAIDKNVDPHRVLKMASQLIQDRFQIAETTMQIEEYVTDMEDCHDCKGPQ